MSRGNYLLNPLAPIGFMAIDQVGIVMVRGLILKIVLVQPILDLPIKQSQPSIRCMLERFKALTCQDRVRYICNYIPRISLASYAYDKY
jgi:hypothetical protein